MASVIRTSILGAMPGGEVWSVNPCFFLLDEPASITSSEALTIANAINAITVPTGIRNVMNVNTTITGVRVEARDRNGLLEAQAEAARATPIAGLGGQPHPYQTSSVTSLRSGFPGAQGRGRLYWPATGCVIASTTLRMDPAVNSSLLSGVKTYLTAIEAAVAVSAGPADLAVWSRTGTAFHVVTSLRQGDVLDTQRRRRDVVVESYTELAYPWGSVYPSHTDGEGYKPDVFQDDPSPETRKARRRITPPSGGPFAVQFEYDDGNGMWIVTGVSPCGQE